MKTIRFEIRIHEIVLFTIFLLSIMYISHSIAITMDVQNKLSIKFSNDNELFEYLSIGYLNSFVLFLIIDFLPRYRKFLKYRVRIYQSLQEISSRNNDILIVVSKYLNNKLDGKLLNCRDSYSALSDEILIDLKVEVDKDCHGPKFRFTDHMRFFDIVDVSFMHIKYEIDNIQNAIAGVKAEKLDRLLLDIKNIRLYKETLEFKISSGNAHHFGYRKADFLEILIINKELASYGLGRKIK